MSETRRMKLPTRDRRRVPRESLEDALANDLTVEDEMNFIFGRWRRPEEPAVVPYKSPYLNGEAHVTLGDLIKERKAV